MYTDEAKAFPTYAGSLNNGAYNWDAKLLSYMANDKSIFFCGALPPGAKWSGLFNPSYGYNTWGTDGSDTLLLGLDGEEMGAMPENHVLCPSDMIAIGDSPVTSWTGIIIGATNDGNQILDNRHYLGANLVFCDGHVEFGLQTNWMKANNGARMRWNNDHQPHPGTWF